LESLLASLQSEFDSIKIHSKISYEIFEEGEHRDKPMTIVSPVKLTATESFQRNKAQTTVQESRNEFQRESHTHEYSRGASSQAKRSSFDQKRGSVPDLPPQIPEEVVSQVEETYFGRPGPKIHHGQHGRSFKYGTREFVVTERRGKLYAKDVPTKKDYSTISEPLALTEDYILLDQYLERYEEEERKRCMAINLELLNDEGLDSSEDEVGDVAEEFDEGILTQ